MFVGLPLSFSRNRPALAAALITEMSEIFRTFRRTDAFRGPISHVGRNYHILTMIKRDPIGVGNLNLRSQKWSHSTAYGVFLPSLHCSCHQIRLFRAMGGEVILHLPTFVILLATRCSPQLDAARRTHRSDLVTLRPTFYCSLIRLSSAVNLYCPRGLSYSRS